MIGLQLGLQIATLQADNAIGQGILLLLRDVLTHQFYQVGEGHHGTAHNKVVLILLILATQMGGLAVLQANGIAPLLCHQSA